MSALIVHHGRAELSIYAPFQDEAARLQEAIRSSPQGMIQVLGPSDDKSFKTKLDIGVVTKDAKVAVSDADLILLPLPAFAVGPTLKDIGPYIKKGAYVGMLPGQGGCQWAAADALGKDFYKERDIVLFAAEKLPYNVRVLEYGQKIRVFSYKKVGIGAVPLNKTGDVVGLLKECVPYMYAEPLSHILDTTLTTGNQCIHPARMYSLANPKESYQKNPLFYEEMDKEAADRIQAVSDELRNIARAIERKAPAVNLEDVIDIRQALVDAYGKEIEDDSSLLSVLRTNKGFKGIYSPMVESEGGVWKVDWKSRYLSDDVPYGLCVLRGLAEFVDVKTPTVDMLLLWAQEHMGKSYLVNGRLCGSDVKATGAPQAFGFMKLHDLPDVKSADKVAEQK